MLITRLVILVGTVLVGVSGDDVSHSLTDDAKDTMLKVTGVDLTSVVFRGKFVFVAQVGSPQKVVMELRDGSEPAGVGMDVLITGRSLKAA